MRSVHRAERRHVTHYPALVPVRIVCKASSAAENDRLDIRQEAAENLALFADPTEGGANNVTAAQQVMLTVLCKKPVLVSTKLPGVKEAVPHENRAKKACVHDS